MKKLFDKPSPNVKAAPKQPTISEKFKEKQKGIDAKNADRTNELFNVDYASLNAFSLPSKPEKLSTGIINTTRKKITVKANETAEQKLPEEDISMYDEYHFLPEAMGSPRQPKDNVGDSFDPSRGNFAGKVNNRKQDLNEVDDIMARILTGDDAVNFFARYGSETPVKFVHLIQKVDRKVFNPYELVTATVQESSAEYFTMSPAGIVQITPGQPSECMPLSQWMRQKINFGLLRNIHFYGYYLHRKVEHIIKLNLTFE